MSELRNVNVFDQIQSLCREYRRQLKQGSQESIESYLQRIDESARENLFQNLLHIDIEFRRRQQEVPSSDEYISRFPSYSKLVRQAFFESTMMSYAGEETPAETETILFDAPAARKLGEYELLRQIGRGGFGAVYKARHLQQEEIVALKLLPSGNDGQGNALNDAERLHKFRREFRSLADINHPNLIGMQALECDGNQWFFTMDLIEGTDFLDYVRPTGVLDETRLRKALTQLVDGIASLHRKQIIHRDLKPSNVMVDQSGRVIILDFGLVIEQQPQSDRTVSMTAARFAGTPRYAAPEQMSGEASASSDWYALGVMLYEALTGRPPFEGANVMVDKLHRDAPALTTDSTFPHDLSELTDQLLVRDPELRPSGTAIQSSLGIVDDSMSHDSTESGLTFTHPQTDYFLIGRENQLEALERSFALLSKNREPVITMVSGRSGEGKTSLVNKFLDSLRQRDDVLVLSGRCYDRESVPYKAIDPLIDSLVAFLRSRTSDEVHAWLPDDIHMLAHLFPVLRRVEAVVDRSTRDIRGIDSRQIRYRAFNAFRELLIKMGQTTPVVLFVDDLQWGDADSAGALYDVLAPPDSPKVLLLGSYRSDEAEESPFLTEWKHKNPLESPSLCETLIEVAPLTEDQCVQLIATRIGIDREQLQQKVANLYQETQGNPYFLEQLIEGFDAETGQFQAVPLEKIIDRKLQRLPSEAAALLDVIAVAGQASPAEEIAKVTQSASQAFSTLTHMRSERLIRLIGSSGLQQVDTYHDKIRETVLASMEPSKRRSLHIHYGEYLEQTENLSAEKMLASLDHDLAIEEGELPDSDRMFDIAYHFYAAEDGRAFAYQLMAGELSYRAYAAEDALEFLLRASNVRPVEVSSGIRFRLYQRLARSLSHLSKFDEATDNFKLAFTDANSDIQRANIFEGIASTYRSRSQYQQALTLYDKALHELGLSRPGNVVAIAQSVLILALLLLRRPRWDQRATLSQHDAIRHSMAVQIHLNCLSFVWELPNSIIKYVYNVVIPLDLSRKTKSPSDWAAGVAVSACHFSLNGLPWIGRWLLKQAQQVENVIDDEETKGYFLLGAAFVNHYSSSARTADRLYSESLLRFSKSANHTFVLVASHMQRHLYAVIETASNETECGERVVSIAEASDDSRSQCWGHYDIASGLARSGEIAAALRRIESAREHLQTGERNGTDAIFLGTEGFVRLQASAYDAARLSLEAAWYLIKRRKLLMDVMVRALPYLIESLLGPDWIHPVGSVSVTRLRRLCRFAAAMDWMYPNIASPAQRARGRAFCNMGRTKKAIRCFHKAIERSEKFGADYDKARSLLDLAAVKEEGREENRREAIELLKKMESVIPYAERWLLGDQYDPAVVAPTLESVSETPISLETKQVD